MVGTAVAQLIHIVAMHTPGLRDVLHLEQVFSRPWLFSLALAVSLFFVSELHEVLVRRRATRQSHFAGGTA